MALSDFTGISGAERLYLRSTSGLVGTDGNRITGGWTDDSSNEVDADMRGTSPDVPTYTADPGDGNGPVATHAGERGFYLNHTPGTTYSFFWVGDFDSLTGFRNIFSSIAGGAGGSLYANGGTLTVQDASTESTGYSLSTGTIYRIVVIRTPTNYRLYVNGALEWTSSTITPTNLPDLCTSAYGGATQAQLDGDTYCFGVYSTDVSANIATLDAAMQEEVDGVPAAVLRSVAATGSLTADVEPTIVVPRSVAAVASLTASVGHRLPQLRSVAAVASLTADVTPAEPSNRVDAVASLTANVEPTVIVPRSVAAVASLTASVVVPAENQSDDFAGNGSLVGWETINAADVSDVTRTNGRYRAAITGSPDSDNTWFDALEGRLDYREFTFPFDVRWLGVRIGTTSDYDTEPTLTDEFVFTGGHINNDVDNPTDAYQHVVVGNRGTATGSEGGNTLELKTTISADSEVDDIGPDALQPLRADIRAVGTAGSPNTVAWYYREEGDTTWIPLTMPGTEPSWNNTVAIGLATYAFSHFGPDFAGYIEAFEDASPVTYSRSVAATASGTANVEPTIVVPRSVAATGALTADVAATSVVPRSVAATSSLTADVEPTVVLPRSATATASLTAGVETTVVIPRAVTAFASLTANIDVEGLDARSVAAVASLTASVEPTVVIPRSAAATASLIASVAPKTPTIADLQSQVAHLQIAVNALTAMVTESWQLLGLDAATVVRHKDATSDTPGYIRAPADGSTLNVTVTQVASDEVELARQ